MYSVWLKSITNYPTHRVSSMIKKSGRNVDWWIFHWCWDFCTDRTYRSLRRFNALIRAWRQGNFWIIGKMQTVHSLESYNWIRGDSRGACMRGKVNTRHYLFSSPRRYWSFPSVSLMQMFKVILEVSENKPARVFYRLTLRNLKRSMKTDPTMKVKME